jgi:two-component system cell cycle sensor histidine kinase/response regulator CckA
LTAAATQRAIRVLLVEDNPGDARLILELLREIEGAFEFERFDRLEPALQRLKQAGIDVVLLDLGLPDSQGIETFARAHREARGEPIVVISGLDDEVLALEAVRRGAQDYVVKGRIEGRLLARVIRYAVERKRAEELVHAGQQRFLQLAENISEVFFVVDAQYRETLYINPAYERVWGRTCQSLYDDPKSFLETVHPDDRNRLIEYVRQVQNGREVGEIEFRVVRPDGAIRSLLSHTVPIRNERGEVYRIAGTALDITDRKLAEEALRASEGRARNLFETVHLIVLGLNGEGKVDYVNPFFLQLTGYTVEEVFGKPWVEHFLPKAQQSGMTGVFLDLEGRNYHPYYETAIVTKAGEERLIAWNNTLVRDQQGRPTGTLSIGEDITEHRRLEEQFRHSQKMEAVGRLAGGVAHDFNNLLTSILGYSELLIEDLPVESGHRLDVIEIRAAAERAAGLTRQLLAFSRQQVLQLAVLNVNDVVRNLEKMLGRLLGEDVTLDTGLEPALGNVRADAGQLEQVLANLAVNARDAMPGGGTLTIETTNAELTEEYLDAHRPVTAGSYVMLTVSDTGTGMSAESKARLFEPFYTTKEVGKGTGLGLSTTYGIVKQLGGYIWVYSEMGRGTAFKIYLPRVNALAESVAVHTISQGIPSGNETVVLAEDNEQLRKLLGGYLERLGYRVLAAAHAAEALGQARGHAGKIHLLVTDIVMPGESGRKLADQLTETRPDMRILFMSGYSDLAMLGQGLVEPGLHYLQKPFTPAGLARRVREVLDAE